MRFLLFFVVTLLTGCSQQNLPAGSHKLKFEASIWQNEESANWNEGGVTIRQQMLGSLLSETIAGKNREQIIELLGHPATKMDPDGAGPNMSYPTGPQRDSYMAIDYEWLIIKFDVSGKYESFYLASD
ncbi:hypothetical protein [Paraglaciecola arctica]|uniref:hypothetical protein n=1 Tax=Paraglaciecola arctica TaxID=1128911 RepID=UPI001C068E13|nr:hypothetical protein [Paraglaciecola arctica]MBU3003379.1 hypothetical protein [Paraglaciecola arctica]